MKRRTAKGRTPRPTDAELEILRVLWRRGPSTVREMHGQLGAERGRPAGYTTVLKIMQIMTVKGLIVRDERQRPQLYSTRHAEDETQRRLLRDLLDRAFGGSHRRLVLQVLEDRKATEDDLSEVEALLDRLDREEK